MHRFMLLSPAWLKMRDKQVTRLPSVSHLRRKRPMTRDKYFVRSRAVSNPEISASSCMLRIVTGDTYTKDI